MGPHSHLLIRLVLATLILSPSCVQAQQHRATHLGNPATRFAPPVVKPEELRARFRDPKLRPDIAAVLGQWGWKGSLDDLYRAAATARITEERIPPGTRLPFMSSRRNGKPVALRDVLWAGEKPVDAYAFVFSSNGRRYRCLTPKLCSNFLVIDLGPDHPKLELELTAPPEASLCEPIPMKVLVRNAGHTPLTQVRITAPPPSGWKTPENLPSPSFELGTLRAGEVRELEYALLATGRGTFTNLARATSAEGGSDHAMRRTVVRAPVLGIDCAAPAPVPIGRPVEVCLTIRNSGDAPDPKVTVTLSLPGEATLVSTTEGGAVSEGRVVWQLPNLAPNRSRKLCAVLTRPDPGTLSLAATAQGLCAQAVQTACEAQVAGVPGILLEVIDLEDPIEVGHEVTYVIRVTNQGSSVLNNIRPTSNLAEIQEFVSATGTTPLHLEERTLVFDPVAALEPKTTATWNIVTRARESGNALFQVDVACDQLPRAFGENEVTNQY